MNATESSNKFLPKQALAPTPQHYAALVGDGMERLAAVSLKQIPPISAGATIHDNGCGTGAATAAVLASVSSDIAAAIKITGTDIVEDAVKAYSSQSASSKWSAEGLTMDSNVLSFADETFSHSIGNALLFAGPSNNGIDVVKEMHRTLKPGGVMVVNSFAFVPNLEPLRVASKETRPPGAPLPRQGMDEWSNPEYLRGIVEAGGFDSSMVRVQQCEYYITTGEFDQYTNLLWSFIGGTTSAGWSKEDEEKWDEAVSIVKRELQKTEGFKMLEDGRAMLRFVANVAVATK
ncbi:S-adenosyl-L-methionine-dependent methyltransferase [Thozetella sp. PMI_491]|nr:S-adenosyl-L-methionine-dependent methyltransferase [Thozetella sp. PMI_491]